MKQKKIFFMFVLCITINLLPAQTIFRPRTDDNSSWAVQTLQRLSLPEKVGQLFMIPAVSNEERNKKFIEDQPYKMMDKVSIEHLITHYHVGGIIFLGNGGIPHEQVERTTHYQTLSKLPLLIGQDFEWGPNQRLDHTVRFPKAMTLGALRNDKIIYDIAYEIGRQSQLLGVHLVFAPVVDINNNPDNPVINDRSFGSDKLAVTRKGLLFMQGLLDAGILACGKHFPGHGDTATDSHELLPSITHSKEHITNTELYPFQELIKHNVPAILTAHLFIPALDATPNTPSSLSPAVVTDLLRTQLGFNGLIVTDGLGMKAITNHYKAGELEEQALLAGNDLIVCPVDVPKAHNLIMQAIKTGKITEQQIDEHVYRILCAKEWANLHLKKSIPYEHEKLHTPHAYALKKKAYRQAITLARNNIDTILPAISNEHAIFVQIGESSNALSLYNKLKQRYQTLTHCFLPLNSSTQQYSQIEQQLDPASMIIVAYYPPRRKNQIEDKSNQDTSETAELMNCYLAASNKKSIALLFGTPYHIPTFKAAGTIIVGYEDDNDANDGVADILNGTMTADGQSPV